MKNGTCPKCSGNVIIQGVRILDRGHGNVASDLSLAVYSNPAAWVFKGEVKAPLFAYVCGACGYTELYATNLDALVKTAVSAGNAVIKETEEM